MYEGMFSVIGLGFDADASTKAAHHLADAADLYAGRESREGGAALMGVTGFDGDGWRLWTTRDIGSHRNQDTGKTKRHETYGYGCRCGTLTRLARPSLPRTWEQKRGT